MDTISFVGGLTSCPSSLLRRVCTRLKYALVLIPLVFATAKAASAQSYPESTPVSGGGELKWTLEEQNGYCGNEYQTVDNLFANFSYTAPNGTVTGLGGSIYYLFPCDAGWGNVQGGWNGPGGSDDELDFSYGQCTIQFFGDEYGGGSADMNCPVSYSGFINPKFLVVGVTYAPPGASSFVQYTGTTSVGNTTTIASSFSNKVGFSISVKASIQGWGSSGAVTGTSSTDYTQGSNSSMTTTISKATSLSYKTSGTGNTFAPVDSDYDTIWLWLNPVVNLTYTPPASGAPGQIQWNGYGYDTNDPSGTEQPDIYPVLVGWLNGDFGSNPSVEAILARSWASGANYIWPAGSGPGLTAGDIDNILASDPFTGCIYNNSGLIWVSCPYASAEFPGLPPSTTSDGRFTLVTLPNDPNPIPYEQAGPGNGGGTTTAYNVNQTNTQSVAQGTSRMFQQEFSIEEVFANTIFNTGVTTSLTESDTLTWNNSWLNTLTTTTTLQQALSVTGPNCPAAPPGPCNPEYVGPGQFDVYQDNQYGTFMFYPTN